jgi:DNA (cytosine-5)-methyltransferase 1
MTPVILKYRDRFRKSPQLSINFGELAIDNFAGGGGASTGIEAAIGRPVDIAINHDPGAVAMHEVNHPGTRHFCESVWDVDPRKICGGRPVGIAWFSPDCKHHSKARGGKPVEKKIRGLAWVAVRWAATVKPRLIILENVEEFVTWGPLVTDVNGDCYPCKKRKGQTFRSFVNALRRQGYEVDWRELRACDYGAPTIRKRFFLIARCDGQPIAWPEPTHGDPKSEAAKSGRLLPWRTAAECIDWSLPCPSIFERKRPLAEATLRRIAKGVMRYVVESPEPFIVPLTHHGKRKNHDISKPFNTVTGAHRGEMALVTPFITSHANASNQRNMPADGSLRTQCAQVKGGHFALVTPFISTYYGAKSAKDARGARMDKPIATQTTENRHAVVSAFLAKNYTGVVGSDLDKPIGTVTGIDHHSLVAASVVRHFGESVGSSPAEPVGTITAGGLGKTGIIAANLVRNFGKSAGAAAAGPACTITGKSKDALVTSHLVKLRGTCKDGQPVTSPAPTITASGTHVGEVRAFLMKYYGTDQDPKLVEPLHTVTTKDRFGLVTVKGEEYRIVDIGMRMLSPRELYRAQGFPENYIIDRDSHGKPITKTEQVAKCGNSVCPPIAEALVRANMAAVEVIAVGNPPALAGVQR